MDDFVDAWIVPEVEQRVAEKVVEPNNNEMLFENFIVQGLEQRILTKKTEPTCNIELYKGYSILFDTMIKTKILILTHGDTATVDKTKISVKYLKNALQMTGEPIKNNKKTKKNLQLEQPILMGGALEVISTLPDGLKCFTIHYKKLSKWLQNYQYRNADEDEFLLLKLTKQIGGNGENVKKMLNSFRNKTNKKRMRKGSGNTI